MRDFELVPAPTLFPSQCELCQSQKGPILDTRCSRPGMGPGAEVRVYICRACARTIAKVYGFAKGERMDELEAAADRLTAAESESEKGAEAVRKLSEQLTEEQQKHMATTAQLDLLREQEHQRMRSLQQIIALGNQLVVGQNGG